MVIGPSGRLIFGGFLVVFLTFVAASAFQAYSSRAIDRASRDLDENAMPSIEHLSALTGEVRTVEYLLDRWIDERYGGRPEDRAALEQSLARLEADERAYLREPMFPGEPDLADQLQEASIEFVRAVDESMDAYLNNLPEPAQRIADTTVALASEKLTKLASVDLDLNARESGQLAALITRTRRRDVFYRWLFAGICAVVALLTATALWRSLSRSAQLREEYTQLQERRAQELESFAGRVAHDILSPLSAVRLALSMVARHAEPRQRELLARGQRALTRVEQLTDGLLDFARAGAKPQEGDRCEVPPVVEGVVEELRPFAAESGAELVLGPVPPGAVACASGILTSLLSNLVRNAVKYLGDATRRQVAVRILDRGARLRFEVEDTGPGIDPDLVERLFQPYVRGRGTQQPGLGLGLATVKRLAESHGGAVGVSSRTGLGSLFWFELPKAPAAQPPVLPPEERPSLR